MLGERVTAEAESWETFAAEIEKAGASPERSRRAGLPQRINADPEKVEQGLARLVLTLIELLRRLLEKQAIRRIEGGSLNDDEIERMGQTFLRLEAKMLELKQIFGLEDDDLNINLGPLGDLM
jgi:hypothetical protein